MAHQKAWFGLKRKAFLFATALVGSTSWMACTQFDLAQPEIQANPEFAAAIGRFSFLFSDFIKGDSLLQVGRDSSIALRFAKDSIASYSFSDVVNKATGGVGGNINKTVVMGAVPIPDLPAINQTTALSLFASAFAPPLSTLFLNGGTVPPIPATGIPAFSAAANVVGNLADITDFQSVTLASGMITLQVTNHFPFDITSLTIDILDRGAAGTPVVTTIALGAVTKGQTKSGSGDLTGKTFSNRLAYRIGQLNGAGMAANTVISPTATLAVQVLTTNMKLKSGSAKITGASLAGDTIVAAIATGNAAQKLIEVTLSSGTINYSITKTTPINLSLTLQFPSLLRNGVMVQAGPITLNQTTTTGTIDITGVMNLATIAAQPYNQLPINVLTSVIGSGGAYVNINETQGLQIAATFGNLRIGGAKGQFGSFDIDIPATNQDFGADFGYLSPDSRRLLFANPAMKITYLNSFGISITAGLLVKATGFFPGTEALGLALPDSGKVVFALSRPYIASIGSPTQLVRDAVVFNKNTSNIVNFMGILPKTLATSGRVSMRSSGPQVDFITADSRIKLGIEMDIPLKFSAENLTIRDTLTNFAGVVNDKQVQDLDYAAMDVQYKTRLPLGITVDLATLANGIITPVVTGILLPAADAIDADGKVTAAKSGTFEIKLTAADLLALSNAPKVVMIAKIKTAGTGTTPVGMYTHYDFDMAIGLRIKTKIVR